MRPGKRAERARQTRQRIVHAANDLFVERGYGSTRLEDIADRAGVAVQTIYFTFRNKHSLLSEVVDHAVAGDDQPTATMDRPWFREAVAAETAAGMLQAYVPAASAVLSRVAFVIEVLRNARTQDPDIAPEDPDNHPRYAIHSVAADSLVDKPDARPGLTAEFTADVLYGVLSPELYLLFVRDRAWPQDRWDAWAYDVLHSQLCAD